MPRSSVERPRRRPPAVVPERPCETRPEGFEGGSVTVSPRIRDCPPLAFGAAPASLVGRLRPVVRPIRFLGFARRSPRPCPRIDRARDGCAIRRALTEPRHVRVIPSGTAPPRSTALGVRAVLRLPARRSRLAARADERRHRRTGELSAAVRPPPGEAEHPRRREGVVRGASGEVPQGTSPRVSATKAPRSPIGFGSPTVVSRAVWCSISALSTAPSTIE